MIPATALNIGDNAKKLAPGFLSKDQECSLDLMEAINSEHLQPGIPATWEVRYQHGVVDPPLGTTASS